ncbi:MAG: PaaI family thioesterase [Deltaproteobacteria bacterium]|nr:PaaI family thioesterase [Deltaproteobacteria bacterium]
MGALQENELTNQGNCFACGARNVYGLRMRVAYEDDAAVCRLTLGRQYQGWDEIAHGGIVSTVLDEIMAYAVINFVGQGLTTRMETTYRKAVPLGQPIKAVGRVTSHRGRMAAAEGRIYLAEDDTLLAEATARWIIKLGPDGQPLDGAAWLDPVR